MINIELIDMVYFCKRLNIKDKATLTLLKYSFN